MVADTEDSSVAVTASLSGSWKSSQKHSSVDGGGQDTGSGQVTATGGGKATPAFTTSSGIAKGTSDDDSCCDFVLFDDAITGLHSTSICLVGRGVVGLPQASAKPPSPQPRILK